MASFRYTRFMARIANRGRPALICVQQKSQYVILCFFGGPKPGEANLVSNVFPICCWVKKKLRGTFPRKVAYGGSVFFSLLLLRT